MNIGLLLVRLVLGLTLFGHGAQKLFGWFGGYGISGTGAFFESKLGFRPGKVHAFLAGLTEAGSGLLFALGLATPLAAAGFVTVMLVAVLTVHLANGFFITKNGFEYNLVLAGTALGIAFIGPGAWSLDAALGWSLAGWRWGFGALVLGVVVGLANLATRGEPSPEPAAKT